MSAATTTLSAKEVADKIGTDPRTLRRFLRSRKQGVGTGQRYALAPEDLAATRKAFAAWQKEEDARRASRAAAGSEKAHA